MSSERAESWWHLGLKQGTQGQALRHLSLYLSPGLAPESRSWSSTRGCSCSWCLQAPESIHCGSLLFCRGSRAGGSATSPWYLFSKSSWFKGCRDGLLSTGASLWTCPSPGLFLLSQPQTQVGHSARGLRCLGGTCTKGPPCSRAVCCMPAPACSEALRALKHLWCPLCVVFDFITNPDLWTKSRGGNRMVREGLRADFLTWAGLEKRCWAVEARERSRAAVPCGLGVWAELPEPQLPLLNAPHGTRHIGGLWGWWPLLCSASRATELGSDGGMLIPIICWGHQQHHSFTPLWQVKQAPLRGKRQPRQRGSDNRHRSSLAQTKPWQWMRSGYAKPHEITFLYLTSGPMWSIFKFRPHSSTGLLIS